MDTKQKIKEGAARGGAAAKGEKKQREMTGVEIGRRSAGRSNSNGVEIRSRQRPWDWKGFSIREMDLACLDFFRSRGMPIRTFSEQ